MTIDALNHCVFIWLLSLYIKDTLTLSPRTHSSIVSNSGTLTIVILIVVNTL